MQYLRSLALAAAVVGVQGVASAATYTAVTGTGFTTESTSATNLYLTPLAPAGSTVASYSVLSTSAGFSSTGIISFAAPVTSFSFLWGSPDSFNTVSDGIVSVNGSQVSSGTGNNAESLLYTFRDLAGFRTLTFTSGGTAFEVAVAPVPEPQTYALVLGGLGAIFLIARRRRI